MGRAPERSTHKFHERNSRSITRETWVRSSPGHATSGEVARAKSASTYCAQARPVTVDASFTGFARRTRRGLRAKCRYAHARIRAYPHTCASACVPVRLARVHATKHAYDYMHHCTCSHVCLREHRVRWYSRVYARACT